jgi:hypothetical protein
MYGGQHHSFNDEIMILTPKCLLYKRQHVYECMCMYVRYRRRPLMFAKKGKSTCTCRHQPYSRLTLGLVLGLLLLSKFMPRRSLVHDMGNTGWSRGERCVLTVCGCDIVPACVLVVFVSRFSHLSASHIEARSKRTTKWLMLRPETTLNVS